MRRDYLIELLHNCGSPLFTNVSVSVMHAGDWTQHAECVHFHTPGKYSKEQLEAASSSKLPTKGIFTLHGLISEIKSFQKTCILISH